MTGTQPKRSFWTPFLLGGIAMIFAGLLWRGVAAPPPAYAQIPDSGAQRVRMITEQKATNQKLDQIVKLLTEIRDQQRAAGSQNRQASPKRDR